MFKSAPFTDNEHSTVQQSEFNFVHSSTRMSVKKAFNYFILKLITAICIIHNITIIENDKNKFFKKFYNVFVINVASNSEYDDLHITITNDLINRRMQMFRDLFPE
ncbi:hypothetical protein PUN28_011859 [Cardiocondyla obscurior]|uniref:Uncharacterized protein n=1 Tax=Cardiocondyla obscurior TaxID=286306 RepID=A0AAW2FIJ2_9HYME